MGIVGTKSLEAIYDEYAEDKRLVAEYSLLMETQVVQEKDVKLATIENERDLVVKVRELEENKTDFSDEMKRKEKEIQGLEGGRGSASQNKRFNGRSNQCKAVGYKKVSMSCIKRNQKDEMNGAYVTLHYLLNPRAVKRISQVEKMLTSWGFGFYLLSMDEKTYKLIGEDYPENRAEDVKNPRLLWMMGFIFVVSFLGLFSLVPLRKVMGLDYELTCVTRTTIAMLIDSFHIKNGVELARKQVSYLGNTGA
ncbi:uncharacterized protein LOC111401623 [Olea europaea var. sylvestris]|uniref:uncharacterized protein LOC111401623 n=1 Tax=Olea europaea var. sylvestris TaxID=158386 RepID=UPI000C1D11D1|nr:uncharacterized protein LOC111401623 [Olea europaea var. sylvestris]